MSRNVVIWNEKAILEKMKQDETKGENPLILSPGLDRTTEMVEKRKSEKGGAV